MVRTKHEITQSRTAFPPSPGQVEWTFLDLCCFTHSRRFSTLIPNQQLSRCEAAAGWCWPVYLGPVRCDAVFHTPAGSVSPLSSPLLIPSWLRLRRSPEVVHLLRPKAPASMTCCYPDNVIDAAAGPKSYQADDTRRMTKRCLSSAVTAPRRCIPRPKLIKMIRFVSVTANSSVCLHPTIRDTCSQEKVKRCWIQFLGSFTFNDSSRYVYQNSSAGFWTIHERMKLRNDRHIFCKPASERCSIFTVYYTAVYFTSCVKIYDWIILNVYRQPKYIAICQILGNIDIP